MHYDNNNVFAKILRKEISCEFIKENEHAIAFRDIHPQADIHILIIPKGEYKDFMSFKDASNDEKLDFYSLVHEILSELQTSGGILKVNFGNRQEVQHLHMHIMADKA